MVITLEDLYEMKLNYEKEAEKLLLKVSVLDDLISVAEAKKAVEAPVSTVDTSLYLENEPVVTVSVTETETDGSY